MHSSDNHNAHDQDKCQTGALQFDTLLKMSMDGSIFLIAFMVTASVTWIRLTVDAWSLIVCAPFVSSLAQMIGVKDWKFIHVHDFILIYPHDFFFHQCSTLRQDDFAFLVEFSPLLSEQWHFVVSFFLICLNIAIITFHGSIPTLETLHGSVCLWGRHVVNSQHTKTLVMSNGMVRCIVSWMLLMIPLQHQLNTHKQWQHWSDIFMKGPCNKGQRGWKG